MEQNFEDMSRKAQYKLLWDEYLWKARRRKKLIHVFVAFGDWRVCGSLHPAQRLWRKRRRKQIKDSRAIEMGGRTCENQRRKGKRNCRKHDCCRML